MLKLVKQIIIDTLAPTVDRVALLLIIIANLIQNLISITDPNIPLVFYVYIELLNNLTVLLSILVIAFLYAVRKQIKKLNQKYNDLA
jgi:hypothetical protein